MALPVDISFLQQEFVDVVLKKIKITRETARENLQRTQESMKEKHDQSVHDSTFNIM